jgi:delta-aminolevulinic acid dehydratase/porphobilinogen synthase
MILKRRKHLRDIAHENEKNQIALETLQRLMITLSHYLLNANVVIGGEVRHSRKTATSEDSLASLNIILREAKKIDSVIHALRKITTIRTANYTSEGHDLMIDITEEIEEQLHRPGSLAAGKNKKE